MVQNLLFVCGVVLLTLVVQHVSSQNDACVMSEFGPWIPISGGGVCRRYRVRSIITGRPSTCPPRVEVEIVPCGNTEPPTTTHEPCPPWTEWSAWSDWVVVPGTDPCIQRRTRTRTRGSPCEEKENEGQDRTCPCAPWTSWSVWSEWAVVPGSVPCIERRTRTRTRGGQCPPDVENGLDERPCPETTTVSHITPTGGTPTGGGDYGTVCINIPRTEANSFCTGPTVSLSCWREGKREEEETEEEETEEEAKKRHDNCRCGAERPKSEPGNSTRVVVKLPALPTTNVTINIPSAEAKQFVSGVDVSTTRCTNKDVWIMFCKTRPEGSSDDQWRELKNELKEPLSEMDEAFSEYYEEN